MSDGMRFEARMSDMDALMWAIEKDPLLRSTITAVAILDRAPDRDRLIDKIERGTRQIPRLRQKAVTPPFSVAPPAWVTDPNFDLSYHVRFVRAAGDGSMHSLLEIAEPIAMQGFDRARPLWEFTVVEGLADGRAAMIQKVHHSVTDGVGGIKIAMMLLDLERDPAPSSEPMPDTPEAAAISRWAPAARGHRPRTAPPGGHLAAGRPPGSRRRGPSARRGPRRRRGRRLAGPAVGPGFRAAQPDHEKPVTECPV